MDFKPIELEKKFIKADFISGFIVFLIALPLCLGISIASGFPPIAGIYTAILGGLIGVFSGSQLTIKGPAAGLIVIILGAVQELGKGDFLLGYQLTLGLIVISGLLQILFGLFKIGSLAKYFPLTVIRGMMASIGIIIIIKQIYLLFGLDNSTSHLVDSVLELPNQLGYWRHEIAFIGFASLMILVFFPMLPFLWVKKLPTPILVVIIGIIFSLYYNLSHSSENIFNTNPNPSLGPQFLVEIPSSFLDGFQFPDFSGVWTIVGLKYIVLLSVVGSLESLLTVSAIDSLDPLNRKTNPDRDVLTIGAANTIAGLIGGLPMISEVVRSSANVQNGGRSWLSNFFHGIFLLVFVAFLPGLIQLIPLSALSAILIYTGFRLASPGLVKQVFTNGWKDALIFILTIVITIIQDLLVGIAVGTIVYYIFIGKPNPEENRN